MTDDTAIVRVAGTIKLCPECNIPYDDYTRLKNHFTKSHGNETAAALPESLP